MPQPMPKVYSKDIKHKRLINRSTAIKCKVYWYFTNKRFDSNVKFLNDGIL